MCSVLGCASWRRGAKRFNLPEDPERRLAWVEFIFEVNGQRLKESSWTDITICSEHFTEECFENPTVTEQLKARAVPSLCVKPDPGEPTRWAEPVETTDVACQSDKLDTYAVTTKHIHTKRNVTKKSHQQMCIVNERCLFQLLRRKCPLCGCKLQTEKVTCALLIVLNQHCPRCEYRNQWKSQVGACILKEELHLDGTEDAQKAVPTTVSEIVTFSDEEGDSSYRGEEGDEAEGSSEDEWNPTEDSVLDVELSKSLEDETDNGDKGEKDFISQSGLKINELCPDCGCFFNVQKPHMCEHKIKPYSCNICGKRCVTELSLKSHSIIHSETYEHPCTFCHMPFITRLDKLKHEHIHLERKDPYMCPDCPETFAYNAERRVHLSNHRTEKEFNCGVCRRSFNDVHHLRRHSVVHTGLKPYKCPVCQRGFNQGSHLTSHMRLHTGERPFKCQHCDQHFNHNVSLKSHMQRYHVATSDRKRKVNRGASGPGDNGDQKDGNTQCGMVEHTEVEVQKEKILPKNRRRCTGRPKGRPKRKAGGNPTLQGQKGQRSDTIIKSVKPKKFKKALFSEEEQSDSDVPLNSAEDSEEVEEKAAAKESSRRPKGRRATLI